MRGLLLVGALGLEISFLLLFARQAASVVGGFGILSQEENSFTESLIPGLIFLFALGGGGGMGAGEIKNHLLKSCGEQEVEA
jgi:hypothetical protein